MTDPDMRRGDILQVYKNPAALIMDEPLYDALGNPRSAGAAEVVAFMDPAVLWRDDPGYLEAFDAIVGSNFGEFAMGTIADSNFTQPGTDEPGYIGFEASDDTPGAVVVTVRGAADGGQDEGVGQVTIAVSDLDELLARYAHQVRSQVEEIVQDADDANGDPEGIDAGPTDPDALGAASASHAEGVAEAPDAA